MADYSDRYGNSDPDDPFRVESTIDFPSMNQSDPNPNGTLDSVPNAAFAGYGTGGETLERDGSATTRWKSPGAGTHGNVIDGGTP